MTVRPWMKFYPTDWRADPRLRMCSLSARGLWIDLISYMHEGEPYGHLTIDGAAPDLDGIAALVGRPRLEVRKALEELDGKQVCGRTEAGVVFSRRMVRDEQKAERDKANGKSGGNPQLNGGVNPPDNGVDKAQRLEARNQKLELTREGVREFEEWYAKYPRREARGAAERAYRTARKSVDASVLIAGAEKAKQKYAGSDPKFVPLPATWLNQKRWLDEPAAPAGGQRSTRAEQLYREGII